MTSDTMTSGRVALSQLTLLTIVVAFVSILLVLICTVAQEHPLEPLCWLLAAYSFVWLIMARSISNPLLIFAVILFMYSYFPTLVPPSSSRFLYQFGIDGARNIHACAIVSFFVAHAAALLLMPVKELPAVPPSLGSRFSRAAVYGGASSAALSMAYIVTRGSVIGGSTDYADAFAERLETGTGVFLLAAPLAIASCSFAAAQRVRFRSLAFVLPLIAFGMLFVAHGQRKYFIIPALIIAAGYIRNAKPHVLMSLIVFGSLGYSAFIYFGFLRMNGISALSALDGSVFAAFLQSFGTLIAGETPPLYATASAAYSGAVEPLPMLGDYLFAWAMALPQFLNLGGFSPANVRFAFALDPITAARGLGWGFSYWAEAYMVAGYLGVAFAATLAVFLFRAIFVRAGGYSLSGIWGVVTLASLYFALWAQRNALAYTFKEFIVYELAAIFFLFWISKKKIRV